MGERMSILTKPNCKGSLTFVRKSSWGLPMNSKFSWAQESLTSLLNYTQYNQMRNGYQFVCMNETSNLPNVKTETPAK